MVKNQALKLNNITIITVFLMYYKVKICLRLVHIDIVILYIHNLNYQPKYCSINPLKDVNLINYIQKGEERERESYGTSDILYLTVTFLGYFCNFLCKLFLKLFDFIIKG